MSVRATAIPIINFKNGFLFRIFYPKNRRLHCKLDKKKTYTILLHDIGGRYLIIPYMKSGIKIDIKSYIYLSIDDLLQNWNIISFFQVNDDIQMSPTSIISDIESFSRNELLNLILNE